MRKVSSFFGLMALLAFGVLSTAQSAQAPAGVPVFKIAPPPDSKITFNVKASVAIDWAFDKWDATVKFASTDPTTGVSDIKVEADSVNTGSGMKNGKLKGKDFFDVKNDPYITFHSDKIVQTGPNTFDIPGTFTIRGVSKPETLVLTVSGEGTGSGTMGNGLRS